MTVVLTSRQVRTLEWLFEQDSPTSISSAAAELRLSPRVVRSSLDGIERYLAEFAVRLERRRGLGIWLEGPAPGLKAARLSIEAMEDSDSVKVYTASDRRKLTLFELLVAAPASRTVEQLAEALQVSLTSARRDLVRAEPWFIEQGLFLARQPGLGISVIGTETAIRRSLVKLLLETVPLDVLASEEVGPTWYRVPNIGAGIRRVLRQLPLSDCHGIVQRIDALRRQARHGHPWLAADLAVTAFRISTGKVLTLEPGELRSLVDHPVWETAVAVAAEMAEIVGAPLADPEIGGITEHLLGMAELTITQPESSVLDASVEQAIAIASATLHPGLADDAELARSMNEHFDRLRIRIRYGLPVHNPLLSDVSARYPDVHAVATKIANETGLAFGGPITEDEAGYITMYLSGAMERLRLKPRRRAIVVCPSGVATAWILVSRIQAEFPELDLVDVLSAGSIDDHADLDADVVISTVAIADAPPGVPIVVVNALLPADDVRKVSRRL